jgi:hypothetical protein
MKTKLLAMMLLAGGSMFAQTRFSVGIGFGGGGDFYRPTPAYASNIPPCPGPDYTWVDGYWSQGYGGDSWVAGYWSRQAFFGGYGAAPRFDRRFRDDDRREFNRGFNAERNRSFERSFEQGRNFGGQNRDQSRSLNQGQGRDFGQNQNQNQNRGNNNRGNGQFSRQGNDSSNGFRGR